MDWFFWLQVWFGLGAINGVVTLIFAKEVFDGKKDQFSEEEFQGSMFVFVVAAGPLGVALNLNVMYQDYIGKKEEKKWVGEWAEEKEEERKKRENLKSAASALIDCNLERLLSEAELEPHPEPKRLAEECIELGVSARRVNLSSLSNEEKLKIVGLLKKVRINAGTLLEDLSPREQAVLSGKLSNNLSKLQKKFSKALKGL